MRFQRLFFAAFFLLTTCAYCDDATPVKLDRLVDAPSKEKIERSISKGVHFLFDAQNPNGSWGSARNTKELNIYAPGTSHDGFRAGTTGLALAALLEIEAAANRQAAPLDLEKLGIDAQKLKEVIDKGEFWMIETLPKLRRSHTDALYNVWGHAYGIQALTRMHQRFPDDKNRNDKIKQIIAGQIEWLKRFESIYGGWFYYDEGTARPSETTASFVTATVLVAFREAKDSGVEVPQKMVDSSMASMKRQRKPDFTYLYGEYLWKGPMLEINRSPGSLGRSQACNISMKMWGDEAVTDEILVTWLDRLFARNGWLDVGRKRPVPHESFFAIAGYFFYYAHFYAALCIETLPEENQAKYKEHLADVLLGLQETDGSWWDYPLYDYHKSYGTGFSILALLRTLD